jgi:hypothetical protein
VLGLQRLGVSGGGHYRGGGVEGRLLEGMGALREGKGWKDFCVWVSGVLSRAFYGPESPCGLKQPRAA